MPCCGRKSSELAAWGKIPYRRESRGFFLVFGISLERMELAEAVRILSFPPLRTVEKVA